MNVMHYSLGVYPERQGGLVKYSTDLAFSECEENQVFYCYPGKLGLLDHSTSIKPAGNMGSLKLFKIQNAHPIPLYNGIVNVEIYTQKCNINVFINFLKINKIDVIHLHTIMGLHIELLKAAKILSIPVVMTTHDFFGICPVTKLFKLGDVCGNNCIDDRCYECSKKAFGYLKLVVGQSILYKKLKRMGIISSLRQKSLTSEENRNTKQEICYVNYKKLNDYYVEIFKLINLYLFNSNQTKSVFLNRLPFVRGVVIPVEHNNMVYRSVRRTFMKEDILRLGYMGECTDFKGYEVLKTVVNQLVYEGYNIKLFVYNDYVEETDNIKRGGKYSQDDLYDIYDKLDLIVVPSMWYETFGFVVVEALAQSMPCLVTNRVGAKDYIVNEKSGFIINASQQDLLNAIIEIYNHCEKLQNVNRYLMNNGIQVNYDMHVKKILDIYHMVMESE